MEQHASVIEARETGERFDPVDGCVVGEPGAELGVLFLAAARCSHAAE